MMRHSFLTVAMFYGMLLSSLVNAQDSFLSLEYQNFQFDKSKQKDKGQRYIVHAGYHSSQHFFEAAYAKTHTKTFQPPMTDDLNVDKYYLKYTYSMDQGESFGASYATISDNLTKETDGGHIYGLFYRYHAAKLTQYFSDYTHFNTYQTNLSYTFKYQWQQVKLSSTLMGMYIHLQDRKSNKYTAKAKADYFSPAIILKARYNSYHAGTSAFFGKRLFAMMRDGFSIQSRAMEFDRTYTVAVGKRIDRCDITLRYIYMRATEVPIENKNVTLNNLTVNIKYHF